MSSAARRSAATKGNTMDKTRANKGHLVGYVRVSSTDQNTDRQDFAGIELDKVFTDKASGKDTNRPALKEALGYVREGDTLVVHSMDRLARSLVDLLGLVKGLTARGVSVRFLKEGQLFTGQDDPMANLMLSMLGAVAEFERSLILERQKEGIAKAKAKGVYQGRGAKLTPEQVIELKAKVESRKAGVSMESIAKEYGISRQTLYQYLKP
jgi:DNA invertase Pin-like site-specific DNA recombinase